MWERPRETPSLQVNLQIETGVLVTFQNGLRDILSGLHMQGEHVEANETRRLIILNQKRCSTLYRLCKSQNGRIVGRYKSMQVVCDVPAEWGRTGSRYSIGRVRLDNAGGRTGVIGEMRHSGDLSRPTLGLYRKICKSVRLRAGNI